MSKKTKITYRQVDDYKIPNIILPPEQANIIVGKWGMMHKDYLEHSKSGLYMLMITKCTLWPYLADIDCRANEMYELLIEQMKEAEGVTEQLKEQDKQLCNIIQTAKRNFCLPFKFYTDFTRICLWILLDNCKIQVKCK